MGKTIPLPERFWAKVRKHDSDQCWLWTASKNVQGYGIIWDPQFKRMSLAHRVAFRLAYYDPEHLEVHHLCHTKLCVNPEHLSLIERSAHRRLHETYLNGARAMAARTHCPKGHPYDDENTARRPLTGSRVCRKCENIRQRKWQAMRAALRNGAEPEPVDTCPTCGKRL